MITFDEFVNERIPTFRELIKDKKKETREIVKTKKIGGVTVNLIKDKKGFVMTMTYKNKMHESKGFPDKEAMLNVFDQIDKNTRLIKDLKDEVDKG